MTKEQAVALLEIVNKEVNEDEKCIQLSKNLMHAIENNDSDSVHALTDRLDDAVAGVIHRLQDELKVHMARYEDVGE